MKVRNVDGVLLLDKPYGQFSNKLVFRIKKIFFAKKVGHTGTLDPLATGMLPICFGEATKFSKYLLNADKHYEVLAKFGVCTDTFDADGRVIEVRPVVFNEHKLLQVIKNLQGKILQIPPMFSAIRYQGIPLYKYARRGINLSLVPRLVNIYNIKIIFWNRNEIMLKIFCSKGTYIRSIIHSIGEILGCGAYVVRLRRVMISNFFKNVPMVSFSTINSILNIQSNSLLYQFNKLDSLLLPIDSIVSNMPVINLSRSVANVIRCGQSVRIVFSLNNGLVRITEGFSQRFIGVGEIIDNNLLVPRRLLSSFFCVCIFLFIFILF